MVAQGHAMVCRARWYLLRCYADCFRDMTPFRNEARKDGLMLRHWKKRDTSAPTFPATPADSNAASEMETDEKPAKTETYPFTKFNVKIERPSYTEEQYETHLKSDTWGKQETDYLVNLSKDYDLRWVVIADRYEYNPGETSGEGDAMTVTIQPTPRTMEDMKARYYEVAAKTMALHHPMSSMSTAEFDLHEKMTKFDPTRETTRKKLAEGLLHRTPDEIKEEEILLGELKRIVTNEERFSRERKELYERLQAPQSTGSTQMYQSSNELTELMKTLLNVDKNNKKRRSLMGPGDGISSPGGGSSGQNFSGQGDRGQRHSMGGAGDKKGSMSGSSGQRQLSPREEIKYGVTHHERLTAGITFRHEKITKLSQAKSNVQSTKIAAALTELKIPPRLVMPTTKVCNEYERLIQSIHNLLDVRKISEKVESEIKILRAQREEKENRDSNGELKEPTTSEPLEADTTKDELLNEPEPEPSEEEEEEEDDDKDEEDNSDNDDEAKDEDEDNDDPMEDEPTANLEAQNDEADYQADDQEEANETRSRRASVATTVRSGRKRSASVMSAVSNKTLKRQRK